ncbi:peptidase U61 LD-carboxypeptidase A [Thermodesulfatator indicus DSM 15286]|uniref:Peptidase U61 LD-carboxypeptidase A n=1 Tax=Thermodesulfatator indicus (strain DSM 15286 / JCM 11887 / CIR29812) TaxID=667014 RepID=F8ABE2_THEID|nr:LD-carboxypeptidase [Thermodesulfatator indicus]AEH44452.1 peptidase U61 LD-carboxypeptidase A [Thermodesulfatator indicus DSM 15286]
MNKPVLFIGARGAVFSPAGVPDPKKIANGVNFLKTWGLEIDVDPECFKNCRYLAGRDEERALHLVSLLEKPYTFLWASRGGYGSLRLLPLLDELIERIRHPVWIIGFSDVSILLNYFFSRFGLLTLHAPVISSIFEVSLCTLAVLKNTLFGRKRVFLIGEVWREGEAQGLLIGGNLVSVASLLGSRWAPDFSGKILFLEEVNEDLYRLDRLVTQLYNYGVFEEISGLALGEFKGVNYQEIIPLFKEVFNGPILAGLPVGHGIKNYPLVIGARTHLCTRYGQAYLLQDIY